MPENQEDRNQKKDTTPPKIKQQVTSQIVTAEAVQAEEVPTVPLDSFQAVNALQPEIEIHSITATRSVSLPGPLVVHPAEYRRGPGEWVQMWWDGMRPSYLPLSLAPVVVGSVLAWTQTIPQKVPFGHFHILHFLALLVAVVFIQSGAQLVNDYYDYLRGIDTSNTLGPGGLIQQAVVRPATVLSSGLFLLAIGGLLGLVVALNGGLLAVVFTLVGLLCAFFYSATSRSLSSLTLGELVSFFVFGPLLTLMAFVIQIGSINRSAILYSLPLGLLAAAVIHANNLRDMEGDAQAGKHTIATFLSLRMSRVLYLLLLLVAYGIIVALAVPRGAPHLILLTLWTLPIAVVAATGVFRTDNPVGFHGVMRQTIKLDGWFAFWLAVALPGTTIWTLLTPYLPSLLTR
ncbi:MAG TPA: 1,4-dihydroxy-2-naphthoate octaprenyltransferase [Ktedonobacteraceae bacterium]|nr:1,4-dihydroxy-2-naphthoate octaprenyltransferase [Ktedonobacteraceae bacterium]